MSIRNPLVPATPPPRRGARPIPIVVGALLAALFTVLPDRAGAAPETQQLIVDDSARIHVSAPADWTDVDAFATTVAPTPAERTAVDAVLETIDDPPTKALPEKPRTKRWQAKPGGHAPATPAPGGALPPPTGDPTTLGDDPELNELAQRCYDGDMAQCDELFRHAPNSSDYSRFAHTCAGRRPAFNITSCVVELPPTSGAQAARSIGAMVGQGDDLPPPTMESPELGDPELDALAERCYHGDLVACDELLAAVGFDGPGGTFAASCAGRQTPGNELFHTSCVNGFPNITPQTVPPITTSAPVDPDPDDPGTGDSPLEGTIIPGTERPAGTVTVTDAGDESTTVDLTAVYAVGNTATATSDALLHGREDSFGTVSTFNHRFTSEWASEVVAVGEDGSCTVRSTTTASSAEIEYSDPGRDGNWRTSSIVDGLPVLTEYGADRQSLLMRVPSDANPTPEQIDYLADGSAWLGPALPPTPVGVGAEWTWTSSAWIPFPGFDAPATAVSRLDAVEGDRYTITTELSVHLDDVPAERLSPDIVDVTGDATVTITTNGSISEPFRFENDVDGAFDVTIHYGDGTWALQYSRASQVVSTPS